MISARLLEALRHLPNRYGINDLAYITNRNMNNSSMLISLTGYHKIKVNWQFKHYDNGRFDLLIDAYDPTTDLPIKDISYGILKTCKYVQLSILKRYYEE